MTAAVSFAFAGMSYAMPTSDDGLYEYLSKRVVSHDNTCGKPYAGANNSYSWGATNAGPCCSQHGYCDNSIGMVLSLTRQLATAEIIMYGLLRSGC